MSGCFKDCLRLWASPTPCAVLFFPLSNSSQLIQQGRKGKSRLLATKTTPIAHICTAFSSLRSPSTCVILVALLTMCSTECNVVMPVI